MHLFKLTAAASALLLSAGLAQAADFTFQGNITYNTDVIRVNFTLANDATDVRVWTDGFNSGENFDPITAVWSLPLGTKVGENDDDDTIAPGQTYYDSGIVFDSLGAGNYVFTIAAYPNFSNSDNLNDGFTFDHDTPPVAIGDWCQPASNNCTDQKGTFWRVHLSGVDVAAVPEPQTYALMAMGLVMLGVATRRRRG